MGRPSHATQRETEAWNEIKTAESFNGLVNGQRVRIVISLLFGSKSAKDLMLELTLTSSQLYHHLRELAKSGYLTTSERGLYQLSRKAQYVAALLFSFLTDETELPGETRLHWSNVSE